MQSLQNKISKGENNMETIVRKNTKKSFDFINEQVNKKSINNLLAQVYLEFGGAKTATLADNLKKLGYELVVEPKLNIVAFNHPYLETFELAQLLEERNWKISCSSYPKAIRVILMNHIKKEHLIELLNDLDEINKSL